MKPTTVAELIKQIRGIFDEETAAACVTALPGQETVSLGSAYGAVRSSIMASRKPNGTAVPPVRFTSPAVPIKLDLNQLEYK